jgi:hypothetical protein
VSWKFHIVTFRAERERVRAELERFFAGVGARLGRKGDAGGEEDERFGFFLYERNGWTVMWGGVGLIPALVLHVSRALRTSARSYDTYEVVGLQHVAVVEAGEVVWRFNDIGLSMPFLVGVDLRAVAREMHERGSLGAGKPGLWDAYLAALERPGTTLKTLDGQGEAFEVWWGLEALHCDLYPRLFDHLAHTAPDFDFQALEADGIPDTAEELCAWPVPRRLRQCQSPQLDNALWRQAEGKRPAAIAKALSREVAATAKAAERKKAKKKADREKAAKKPTAKKKAKK